jgi:hypothetical protein
MPETNQFSREQELTIILELVPREESWYIHFRKEHPTIGEDLDSFRVNKQCSCRKRLIQYINNNELKVRETYSVWKNNNPDIIKNHIELALINKKERDFNSFVEPTDISGQVVEIFPDPSAYKSFMDHAKKSNWVYKGMNIMETIKQNDDGKEEVVWLLFFY